MSFQPVMVGTDRCEYTQGKLRIILDNITPTSKGGLEAWCVVRYQENGHAPRPLTQARLDLKGARTVSTLSNQALASSTATSKDEMHGFIQAAVSDTIAYSEGGAPVETLADVAPVKDRWTLRPLIEASTVTRLIAPGGSLKSMLALAIAITVATGSKKLLGLTPDVEGPVLYLDWEADAASHADRLRALCRGHNMAVPRNVLYSRQTTSLYRGARALVNAVAEHRPVLVVVDSTAMARGVSGEGSAEDSTIRMFAALRSLGRPALIVDHKSDEKMRRGISGGYGSIFNRNLARLEWEAVRVVRAGDTLSMALRLEKSNNIKSGVELGFRFTIVTNEEGLMETVTVAPIDPNNVVSFDQRDNQLDKIASFLITQSEAQTVAAIVLATGLKDNQVRAILSRGQGTVFENVTPSGNKGHWRSIGDDTDDGDEKPIPY